jgi:hypothetical protein
VQHLLDHSGSARFCSSFGLDDDPVSNLNVHLRLAPLSVRACRAAIGEVSATLRKSRERLRALLCDSATAITRGDSSAGRRVATCKPVWPAAVGAAGQKRV